MDVSTAPCDPNWAFWDDETARHRGTVRPGRRLGEVGEGLFGVDHSSEGDRRPLTRDFPHVKLAAHTGVAR